MTEASTQARPAPVSANGETLVIERPAPGAIVVAQVDGAHRLAMKFALADAKIELLDVQSSAYNAERNLILNKYEARRATYGILHSLGRFIPAAVASVQQRDERQRPRAPASTTTVSSPQ